MLSLVLQLNLRPYSAEGNKRKVQTQGQRKRFDDTTGTRDFEREGDRERERERDSERRRGTSRQKI